MAFEMARKAAACFSVIDFVSCITGAKRPCYGPLPLKNKPSDNIVRYYYVLIFVYYGGPLTVMMNAVLAIIADGGRAIFVIYREAVEIN